MNIYALLSSSQVTGWQGTHSVSMHGDISFFPFLSSFCLLPSLMRLISCTQIGIGKRLCSVCDVPDLDLFPAVYGSKGVATRRSFSASSLLDWS